MVILNHLPRLNRFFEEGDPLKETKPAAISSTGKRSDEDTHKMINGGSCGNVK